MLDAVQQIREKQAKATVLIANGDLFEASRLRELLARHDYSIVAQVSTGEEAVTGAQWLRPDLVLLGLNLEGELNGMLAAEEIGMTTPSKVLLLGDEEHPASISGNSQLGDFGYSDRRNGEAALVRLADRISMESFVPGESGEWEREFVAA